MKIILFGPPGSGKGTQTQLLVDRYDIPRIVTGEILRAKAKHSSALHDLLESGDLVPDEMICKIVKERLEQDDCQKGYILDGFPRTVAQAEYLHSLGVKLDLMVVLKVADEDLLKRLGGRRVHEASGRVYNIHTSAPKVDGKDDITGEPLMVREDDKPESIKHRLEVYHKTTEPVHAYYRNTDIKLVELDGAQSQTKIFFEIKALVESL